MNEHDEALSAQLSQYEESLDITRRASEAGIWHTETASMVMEAKAQFWRSAGFALSVGSLTGLGWSIWAWVR